MTETAAAPAARPAWADYLELTKPRLSFLSVVTTLVGYLAARPAPDTPRMIATVIGAGACAAGVAALNQWLERGTDALMRRTADRPLPARRLPDGAAFVLGWMLCATGLAVLFKGVNGPSATAALATILSYLVLYTPAKRWTRWNTEIGAVSGALPPLIGWTAAEGSISTLGWLLFGLLYLWQIPHFMAVAWIYRDDYAAARFPMLPVLDPSGVRVARWSLGHAVALVGLTLLPPVLDLTSWAFGGVALLLGAWLLGRAWAFTRAAGREVAARRLFICSILYLPLVLGALVVDRWWLAP